MKTLKKIIIWGLIIFVTLAVIGTACFIIFFPKEKAKEYALERASSILKRDVSIKDVSISVWGGLGVKLEKISVSNPGGFQWSQFLEAEALDIKLQLWPLLRKEIKVNRLVLVEPKISILKTRSGQLNYIFDIIDSVTPPPMQDKLPDESKTAAFAISFEQFSIKNGNIEYVDDSLEVGLSIFGLTLNSSLESSHAMVFQLGGDINVDSIITNMAGVPLPVIKLSSNYNAEVDLDKNKASITDTKIAVNNIEFAIKADIRDIENFNLMELDVSSGDISISDLLVLTPDEYKPLLEPYNISGNINIKTSIAYNTTLKDTLRYNGELNFADLKVTTHDLPGELMVNSADINLKNDYLKLDIDQCSFAGSPLEGSITVISFENPEIDSHLKGKINLTSYNSYIPDSLNTKIGGEVDFNVSAKGSAKDLSKLNIDMYFSGNVDLPELFGYPPETKTSSDAGEIQFKFFANGSAEDYMKMNIDGNLKGRVDLASLNEFLPENGSPEIAGEMLFNLAARGPIGDYSELDLNGTIYIQKGAYSDKTMPESIDLFGLDLQISPKEINIKKFAVKTQSSDFALSGIIKDPFPYFIPGYKGKAITPDLTFEMTSQRMDVDKLFPAATIGAGAEIATLPKDSLPPILLPDISGRGTAAFDTVIYSRVEFTNIESFIYFKNRIIHIADVAGDVYTGKVAGQMSVDLSDFEKPKYDGKFAGKEIEVNDFMARFTNFKDRIFGKFGINGRFSASGWEPDSVMETLDMEADAELKNGKLENFELFNKIGKKLNVNIFKEGKIRDVKTTFTVKNSWVTFDTLMFITKIGDWRLSGRVNMKGRLDCNGSVLLSENAGKTLFNAGPATALAGLLKQGDDRVGIPFEIGGSYTNPSINIDLSSISRNVGSAIKSIFKKD